MNLENNLPIDPVQDPERRIPKASRDIIGEKDVPMKTVINTKVPFYKQDGWKRGCGSVLMIAGGIMTLFPTTSLAGQGVFALGSVVSGIGLIDAAKKSKEEVNNNKGFWAILSELVQKLLEYLKNYKK
jgi:hypothetical protein